MSAHLQFGPEWMRKGPGKTSSAVGAAAGNNGSESTAAAPEAATPVSPPKADLAKSVKTASRRNPSLSNLSSNNATLGPTPVTPTVTTPLAGGFSFAAAAAQAGATKESAPATSSSAALPLSSDGDSARYSMRLLSLYSSERGGKNVIAASPPVEAPQSISPNASQKKKVSILSSRKSSSLANDSAINSLQPMMSSMSGGSLSERDSRRTTSIGHDFFNPPRPHSPNGEARGLNARSSLEKTTRPGLFQRGSAGNSGPAAALPIQSPTQSFLSKERERHGVGIQGGVLAGVVSPPATTRRRKESELGFDSLRSPRDMDHTTTEQQNQQSQQQQSQSSPLSNKRQNDAFTSARSRNTRTTTVDASTNDGAVGSVTNASSSIATSNNNGENFLRREPIGPPADHSGGFAKFAGYEKKRERQASTMNSHRYPSNSATAARFNRDTSLERKREGQSSGDVDLSKHATSVLDSLKLDDEDHNQEDSQPKSQPLQTEWSPTEQEWFYRDPSGQVQGPFQAVVMQQWYEADYFQNDLLVRRAEEQEYKTLHEMKMFIGNDQSPFLVPPSKYSGRMRIGRFPSFEQSNLGQQSPFNQHPNLQSTGWPNPLDNAGYRGITPAAGSNHSSPFATPQISLAELENNPQMRAQYAETIRQREMAEYRMKQQEQQAAQMAALAMAQAQGRDPAAMGLWPSNSLMNSPWGGQQQQHLNDYYNRGDMNNNLWQQQQYQQQSHLQQHQQQHHHQESQPLHHHQNHQEQQQEMLLHNIQAALPDSHQEESVAGQSNHQQGQTEMNSGSDVSLREAQVVEQDEAPAISSEVAQEEVQEDSTESKEIVEEVHEQTPEEAWPQSPSAVEFASEPLMTEEQWAKEESPTRGKKSRRDRTKQRGEDDQTTKQQQSSGYSSGNIKTMSEEQFRSTQNAAKDANGSSQTPLSNWLPDTTTPHSATAAKAAPWANSQQENAGMSLKEIQEAEARRAEAKRASKPRLQLHTSHNSETTSLPTTMTWGLAGSHSSNAPREAASALSPPPAWNAQQATKKKTLMEIQREEEARAKKVKDAQVASNVARSKAYADLASKMQSGIPSSMSNSTSGGNWSVVGASGKAAPSPSVATTNRVMKPMIPSPAAQRSTSSNMPSTLSNGSISRAATSRVSSAKSNDGSPAPSPEFIKHCKEQLKGLNVKVDDFIDMLLSFPLDPSPDVVDIIAESVYASSSTLDGRRFASDFVAKRKLDAAQSRGGFKGGVPSSSLANGPLNATSTARTASDILKSAPATASANDGFGGFKVVKPKGAKKRT